MRILVISPEAGAGRTLLTWSLARELARRGAGVTVASAAPPDDAPDGLHAAVNHEACIGCMRCQMACPHGAVELGGPGNHFVGKTYRIQPELCNRCGECLAGCPSQAISWHFSEPVNGAEPVSMLDGPAGITTRLPSLLYMVDRIVIVSRPTEVSLRRLPGLLDLLADQAARTVFVLNEPHAAPELASRLGEALTGRGLPPVVSLPTAAGGDFAAVVAGLTAALHPAT